MSHAAPLRRAAIALALVIAAGATPGEAAARSTAPRISSVRCIRSCIDARTVAPGGLLRVSGRNFTRGLKGVYRVTASGLRRSVDVRVLTRSKLSAPVPSNAKSGLLYVRDRRGHRSNAVRPLRVARLAPPPATGSAVPTGTAFDGNGMWIWYVNKSSGGDPQAIITQARDHGITTVFVKSADGTTPWAQFSPGLVSTLKAGGLRVCAWQYVYGQQPEAEAEVSAQAVQAGADCFVIDAESEYQGRYAQAQRYMTTLRQAIGPSFPVGLTSFPYVDYHPSLPYSVFFAPGGAQFNAPQVYWKEIGDGLDAVVDHTYRFNRPYGREIVPLGQLYHDPPTTEITRFRQLVQADASPGVSWWDWQEASDPEWQAISSPLGPLAPPAPAQDDASYGPGGKGDLVIWAQEHLNGAGEALAVNGRYDAAVQQAVQRFQARSGLPETGVIDTATWDALLRVTPVPVDWTAQPPARAARTPARRYEIRPHGRG